jgi:hypothetical protein
MTKLVCAWCGMNIERQGYGQTLDGTTSHGMCAACSEALAFQDNGAPLQHYIDTIATPVLVVDTQNAIVAANAKATVMLRGKLDASPVEQPFGLIFDCVHSRRPEGCGRTIHCSGCVIRKSVAATFNTGKAQISVPATLSIESSDQLSAVAFDITTVKKGGLVVMRIDQLGRPHQ